MFLNIDAQSYDDDFQSLVAKLPSSSGTDTNPIFQALKTRHRRTIAHENYHFWQGVRLPFLHLYATCFYGAAFSLVSELARQDENWNNWENYDFDGPPTNRLDQKYGLAYFRAGMITLERSDEKAGDLHLAISAKLMLENAASIFDFIASCEWRDEMSDPIVFRRWRMFNAANTQIFEFLSQVLNSEQFALRAILPLINACFHTSFPEKAFSHLLPRLIQLPSGETQFFLNQKEPCRWPELFDIWLKDLEYDYPFGQVPTRVGTFNSDFYYLDPARWLGMKYGGGLLHPIIGLRGKEWIELSKSVPGLNSFLDLPGYVNNTDALNFVKSSEPPFAVIKIRLKDGSYRVFPVGGASFLNAFPAELVSELSTEDFRGFMADTLAVYGAFRKTTGIHLTEFARNCSHEECPHYEHNYCNSYPIIPGSHIDCGFPRRMADWIHRIRSR